VQFSLGISIASDAKAMLWRKLPPYCILKNAFSHIIVSLIVLGEGIHSRSKIIIFHFEVYRFQEIGSIRLYTQKPENHTHSKMGVVFLSTCSLSLMGRNT